MGHRLSLPPIGMMTSKLVRLLRGLTEELEVSGCSERSYNETA